MSDVLSDVGMLGECVATVADALWKVAQVAEGFERRYRRMLRGVRTRRLPVAVCTMGNGDFGGPQIQSVTTTTLAVFSDAIIRTAWSAHVPIIDLRTACDEPEDYANETVPSARGSSKIAEMVVSAIVELVVMHRGWRVVGPTAGRHLSPCCRCRYYLGCLSSSCCRGDHVRLERGRDS